MCATQPNLQAELKKSPMFNLSLSSKELFHSNMLAWIAEDADTETLFVKILELFGVADDKATEIAENIRKGEYMVLREYKNFDLCICEKIKIKTDDTEESSVTEEEYKEGRILLVLENKFKSIPYKAQLEKYQDDVDNLNIEGLKVLIRSKGVKQIRNEKVDYYKSQYKINDITPHFVLLSLTENIYEFEVNENKFDVDKPTWHYVSYKKYAELIFDHTSDTDFKGKVIKDYANYIKKFSSYLNQKLPQSIADEKWTSTLAPNKDLKPIRMDDIWQKLIANLILIELCKAGKTKGLLPPNKDYSVGTKTEDFIKLTDPDVVHVGAGLSRASGLVEIKINIGHGCVFGVQIQGGLYKRLLETTKNDLPPNKSGQIAYYTPKLNVLSDMFRLNQTDDWYVTHKIFDNSQPLYPKWKNTKAGLQGFGGYDNTFIAQWMKISENATVEEVIAAMIEDCMEVRELFPLVNGNTNP